MVEKIYACCCNFLSPWAPRKAGKVGHSRKSKKKCQSHSSSVHGALTVKLLISLSIFRGFDKEMVDKLIRHMEQLGLNILRNAPGRVHYKKYILVRNGILSICKYEATVCDTEYPSM
jgi:hypothetical protein